MFVNGLANGNGILTWADGEMYVGTFIDGLRYGKGTYWFANGSIVEGDFINGQITGFAKKTSYSGSHYEGSMVNGYYEGFGTYYAPNGFIYIGGFKNGEFNLYGVLKKKDGTSYMGGFRSSLKHGKGIEIDKSGNQIQQYWWNGTLCTEKTYSDSVNAEKKQIDEKMLKNEQDAKNRRTSNLGGVTVGTQTSSEDNIRSTDVIGTQSPKKSKIDEREINFLN